MGEQKTMENVYKDNFVLIQKRFHLLSFLISMEICLAGNGLSVEKQEGED